MTERERGTGRIRSTKRGTYPVMVVDAVVVVPVITSARATRNRSSISVRVDGCVDEVDDVDDVEGFNKSERDVYDAGWVRSRLTAR